jgi:hypothetical protein
MPARVRVRGDLYHGQVPAGAVYVGRGAPGLPASPYANRHRVGKPCRTCGLTHDLSAALEAYRADLIARPELLERARRELTGHDLACWCRLELACHADVLLCELAPRPRE